jgi:cellulose synthase (UDP-forming)
LQCASEVKAVRIVALSTETATLADFNRSYAEAESLYVPDVGGVQIDATKVSQTPGKFTLTPTADQHRAILRLLFRNAPENVAEQGDLLKSMQMLLARAFS